MLHYSYLPRVWFIYVVFYPTKSLEINNELCFKLHLQYLNPSLSKWVKCQCWQLDRGKSNLRERSLRYLELVQKLTFRWQNFVLFKPCNTNWLSSSSIITKNLKAKLANPARYQIRFKEPKIALGAIANTFSGPLFLWSWSVWEAKRIWNCLFAFSSQFLKWLALIHSHQGCIGALKVRQLLKTNLNWLKSARVGTPSDKMPGNDVH